MGSLEDRKSVVGKPASPWFVFGSCLATANEKNTDCIVEEGQPWSETKRAQDI